VVPEVESYNRGSGLSLAYASGLSPPTSARRESAANDVSSCADLQTQYVETHTTCNVTEMTITKQSAQGSLDSARADIAHTKVRHTDLKVDWGQQSTYLQRGVTSLSPLRPAERQMAPHRTSDKDPQTLFGAMAQIVASFSSTPSQRSNFSMQPFHAHRILLNGTSAQNWLFSVIII